MRVLILTATTCFLAFQLQAKQISAIVKTYEAKYTIKKVDNVEYELHKVVSILSGKGNSQAQLIYYEDDSRRMKSYDVTVTDRNGQVVATYNKKDFFRRSIIDAASSYGDISGYMLDCRLKEYPYTVEIRYKLQKKRFFHFIHSFWDSPEIMVLKSTLDVDYPADFGLSYKVNRDDLIRIDSTVNGDTHNLQFSLTGIHPDEYEHYQPRGDFPYVIVVPNKFEYGGIAGSLNSWSDLGAWINELWSGRDELSKPAAEQIDELIAKYPDKIDLAKAIYSFTQQNTRYVAITYGLGGFQTMSAEETYDLGYGDCKALSNFTATAMHYAGIEAWPAMVYAGKSNISIDPKRPMNGFNHVILCLPQIQDTTWLECTSKVYPFGYISNFTDNRYALLLKPDGGDLVKTPAYANDANNANRSTTIILNSDGSASVAFRGNYRNLAMQETAFYRREFGGQKPVRAIKQEVNLPSFDLTDYSSELFPDQNPELKVGYTLTARNLGRRVGSKQMVKPFLMRTPLPELESDSLRNHPVLFKHGHTFCDSIKIQLPEGSEIVQNMRPVDEETDFGNLKIDAWLDTTANKLNIVRSIRVNSGEYQPERYSELTHFLNRVHASQRAFFILK